MLLFYGVVIPEETEMAIGPTIHPVDRGIRMERASGDIALKATWRNWTICAS